MLRTRAAVPVHRNVFLKSLSKASRRAASHPIHLAKIMMLSPVSTLPTVCRQETNRSPVHRAQVYGHCGSNEGDPCLSRERSFIFPDCLRVLRTCRRTTTSRDSPVKLLFFFCIYPLRLRAQFSGILCLDPSWQSLFAVSCIAVRCRICCVDVSENLCYSLFGFVSLDATLGLSRREFVYSPPSLIF